MEYIVTCDVCLLEFNENIIIPKTLLCGHTFCLPCVNNLIASQLNCPKCRKELNMNSAAENYPTNFSIIEAVTLLKNHESNSSISELEVINRIESIMEKLTFRKAHISADLDKINVYLTRLKGLTKTKTEKRKPNENDNELINKNEAIKVLDEIENEYKNSNISHFSVLKNSVNISIKDFDDFEGYLIEIYKRLHQKEQIYAVKIIDEVVKFGEVSFQNDSLLIHSLSETGIPDSTLLILFDELKQCVTEANFFAFLKIICNEKGITRLITIKMLDSQKASKFVTLCTGECGQTYKGCRYERRVASDKTSFSGIFSVRTSSQHKHRIDYISKIKNDNPTTKNEVLVYSCNEGGFCVIRMKINSIVPNVIGKVESPSNLENYMSCTDSSKLKFFDCGIIFKV